MPAPESTVMVPFGGAEHDWAALELASWLCATTGASLELLGPGGQTADGKDASHMLANAALLVQQFAGVSAKGTVAEPGRSGIVAAAAPRPAPRRRPVRALGQGGAGRDPARDRALRSRSDRVRPARRARRRAGPGRRRHAVRVVDPGRERRCRSAGLQPRLQPVDQPSAPARPGAAAERRVRAGHVVGIRVGRCTWASLPTLLELNRFGEGRLGPTLLQRPLRRRRGGLQAS